MKTKLKMIYWKGDKFWVGNLIEHPEIMTQGETLEELEENMKDAYMLMTMEDVPALWSTPPCGTSNHFSLYSFMIVV